MLALHLLILREFLMTIPGFHPLVFKDSTAVRRKHHSNCCDQPQVLAPLLNLMLSPKCSIIQYIFTSICGFSEAHAMSKVRNTSTMNVRSSNFPNSRPGQARLPLPNLNFVSNSVGQTQGLSQLRSFDSSVPNWHYPLPATARAGKNVRLPQKP